MRVTEEGGDHLLVGAVVGVGAAGCVASAMRGDRSHTGLLSGRWLGVSDRDVRDGVEPEPVSGVRRTPMGRGAPSHPCDSFRACLPGSV